LSKEILIETVNLSQHYQVDKQTIVALKNINLKIFESEFVGIYGPSGSGKTTLLQLLGLLEFPTEGNINILGLSTNDLSVKQRTEIRRSELGLIFQNTALLSKFTAFENVEMPLIPQKPNIAIQERKKLVNRALESVNLTNKNQSFPDQLSGGQRQRVAIARALVTNPRIFLADEPTGDLDSLTGKHIVHLLKKIPKEEKKTVIMVTHDDSYHNEFDRIIELRDGQIIDSGE